MPQSSPVPVIDYEGSGYKEDFWEGRGREYEDATERLALRELMPPTGVRIAEIGAGFGRLAAMYAGYEQIVLFDYSRTLLEDAACTLGSDPRFVFVAGNIYELPLAGGVLDTVVMVRVMHHLADVDAALAQLTRVLHARGVAVLEYANKRNLKALLRWGLRQQNWSPLEESPIEFVELNYDFHPSWMDRRFAGAGFEVQRQLAVSHFRLPLLKDRIAPAVLAKMDRALFDVGGRFPIAPSVFVQAVTRSREQQGGHRWADVSADPSDVGQIMRCPACQTDGLQMQAVDLVDCPGCGRSYGRRNGVWDFKEPLA